jgi:hypothetical protein
MDDARMGMTHRIVAAVALAACACNSGYVPRRPGMIAVIIDDGKPTYVRDGRKHAHGIFGGGLVDAVQGNPGAMTAAEEYNGRMKSGFLMTIGGALCSTGALVWATADLVNEDDGNDVPAGLWVSLACLGVMFGGTIYMATAEPYRWDAINIFNDTNPAAYPPPFQQPYPIQPPAPGAVPPGASPVPPGASPVPPPPPPSSLLKMRRD